MKISYKFVNEAVDVEVDETWGAILLELDRREYNNNQTETRRHASLHAMEYEGEAFIDHSIDVEALFLQLIDSETLQKSISSLLPQQSELLLQVFSIGKSLEEIARIEGVSGQAIKNRLNKIYRQLRKSL